MNLLIPLQLFEQINALLLDYLRCDINLLMSFWIYWNSTMAFLLSGSILCHIK